MHPSQIKEITMLDDVLRYFFHLQKKNIPCQKVTLSQLISHIVIFITIK